MTSNNFPPPSELAPHAAPMLMVDEVLTYSGDVLRAHCIVSVSNPLFVPGRGLPSYVGFELMAQTISIFDGLRRRADGETPKIGFLLGCRRYEVKRDWFDADERLDIEVTSLLDEGEMRSFECRILGAGNETFATGTINVYRPDDPEAFFRSHV